MTCKSKHNIGLVLTFILLFIGPISKAVAQKAEVFGHIYDQNTGEPLSHATISVDGTTIGTTSDLSGAYSFKVDTGRVIIRYEFLAYNDTTVSLQLQDQQRIRKDIYLSSDTLLMDEVTVSADRVARKVQKLAEERNKQNQRLNSYQAEVYKLAILSSIENKQSLDDSLNADVEPMAFSERKSTITYVDSPKRYSEKIEAHRSSKNFFSEYDFFSTGGGPLDLNQEEVSVSILSEALTVVGPVSANSGEFYDLYENEADSSWPEGTVEIYFKPLKENRPLFKGKIWYNEQTSSILGMDVSLNEYAHTNTGTYQVSDLNYKQSYKKVDEFWLPERTELTAVISFIGTKNEILYRDEWTWTNHKVNSQEIDQQDLNLNTSILLPGADEKGSDYWNSISSKQDNKNVQHLDEVKAYKEERTSVLYGMYAMRTVFKLPVWLNRSYFTNISDFYHFNRVEGHYWGMGLRTPANPDYQYRLKAGFGFGNESISYRFRGYHFVGNNFIAPEISYHKETLPQYQDYEYNRTPIDFYEARQTLNALVTGSTGINYFERKGLEAGLRFRFDTESFLRVLYVDEKHTSLNTSTSYNVIGNDIAVENLTNNDPIFPAENGNMKGLYAHLHHDTRQYVQTQFLRDYNIRRFGWLADVVLEKGNNKWNSDFDFNRYRVGLKFYWPVFSSHFFQTDITFGASDSGTPHQRMFSYNGFVVDDYVRYRPFNTINYREPLGYRVSELRIRYKFGTSLTRKLPLNFLAKSGIKISTFATVGVIDQKASLQPVLPYSDSHTQAEIGISASRIFGFLYAEFSKRLYGDFGNSLGFTVRF